MLNIYLLFCNFLFIFVYNNYKLINIYKMEEIKIAFKYQGTWIENPNLDETGRFPVEPKEYYGDNYIEALHSEARDLMVELDEKYNRDTCMSLDEYFCEYEFTKDEKNRVWELLNKF